MPSHPNLTKRELRERRRAERQAAERAEAAAATRRRRTWRLLAATGVAIVVAGVAAIVSSSGGASDPPSTSPSQATGLFAGIEEHNGVLGDPNAPITLTEYVDLQCPICAAASHDTLPTLVRDYVRTGKVKLEARTLSFIGPDSVRAARVAAGAEEQGRLWPFLSAFYAAQGQENSGYVTDDFLRSVAAASGVDATKALQAADTAAAQDQLNRANADAQTLGVNETPTFTLAKGDGKPAVLSARHAQAVANAIDKELAG